MSLYSQSMDDGEAGKLTMGDMGGTLLESCGSLFLLAKEGICLESMTGITVQGASDIMALCGAGTSSFCGERQCGNDGRSYGTGRQYIQELCAVGRRPGGGNLTGEVLREILSWDLQQVRRALQ